MALRVASLLLVAVVVQESQADSKVKGSLNLGRFGISAEFSHASNGQGAFGYSGSDHSSGGSGSSTDHESNGSGTESKIVADDVSFANGNGQGGLGVNYENHVSGSNKNTAGDEASAYLDSSILAAIFGKENHEGYGATDKNIAGEEGAVDDSYGSDSVLRVHGSSGHDQHTEHSPSVKDVADGKGGDEVNCDNKNFSGLELRGHGDLESNRSSTESNVVVNDLDFTNGHEKGGLGVSYENQVSGSIKNITDDEATVYLDSSILDAIFGIGNHEVYATEKTVAGGEGAVDASHGSNSVPAVLGSSGHVPHVEHSSNINDVAGGEGGDEVSHDTNGISGLGSGGHGDLESNGSGTGGSGFSSDHESSGSGTERKIVADDVGFANANGKGGLGVNYENQVSGSSKNTAGDETSAYIDSSILAAIFGNKEHEGHGANIAANEDGAVDASYGSNNVLGVHGSSGHDQHNLHSSSIKDVAGGEGGDKVSHDTNGISGLGLGGHGDLESNGSGTEGKVVADDDGFANGNGQAGLDVNYENQVSGFSKNTAGDEASAYLDSSILAAIFGKENHEGYDATDKNIAANEEGAVFR